MRIIARYNTLTFQDAQTKADAITELYQSGMEFGVDQELLKQAMSEIIANQKDTPAVKEVLDQIEQLTQQQIADECMITQATYSGYETGKYLITTLTLYTICFNHKLSLYDIIK